MTKYTAKHLAKRGGGPLCLLLALAVLITAFTTLTPGAIVTTSKNDVD